MTIKSCVFTGIVWLALALTSGAVEARNELSESVVCGSVRIEFTMSNGWHMFAFTDVDSGEPVIAKLYAEEINRKNAVDVWYDGRWVDLEVMQSRPGSRLRIAEGTYARIVLAYEDCLEIIEPKDK